MAEKFNEHVLKVKAGLDKASQQEMREAMRSIFVDEAHIDFNNPENIKGLRELASVMKKIFAQAGNTKFDFTNMIKMPGPEMFDELKKAALEFDQVWSSIVANMSNSGSGVAHGISDGIVKGVSVGMDEALKEAEAKLNSLLKEQEQKIKQIEALGDKQRKKEDMAKRLDYDHAFNVDAKIAYSDDADLKQKVREIEGIYEDALFDLQDAMDTGKVTEPVLEKFRDAAKEMLKVRNTISDLMEKHVMQRVGGKTQTTNKAEALFGASFVERLFGDDDEALDSEIGQAMDLFTEYFDNYDIRQKISDIKKELVGISNEIDKITSQHPELISRQSTAEAEERLQKIHDAYERLFSRRGSTKGELKERDLKHIENTLGYVGHGDKIKALPSDATAEQLVRYKKTTTDVRKKLEDAFRLYDESTNDTWEKRAQYLIKAVAEYESILNNPNADKDLLSGYEDKYKVLSGQVAAERERLEAVVAMARGVATSDAITHNIDPAEAEAKAKAAQMEAEAAEKARQAEEAAAKAREKSSYQSGSIFNNPMFANMFKKPDTDIVEAGPDEVNDYLSEQNGLLENIQRLTTYIDEEYLSAGAHLSDFLDDLQSDSSELDSELKEILTTLNLIDEKGNLTFEVKRNGEAGGGTTHNGALIGNDFVLIERGDFERVKNSGLPNATKDAAKDGVNVAEVLGYLPSKYTKGFFDVQSVANGSNLFENGVLSQDVVNATDEQLQQLANAFIESRNYGFDIENGGSNVVYDKEKGFAFYDLEELSEDEKAYWDSLSESEKKLDAIGNLFALFSDLNRDHTNYDADQNIGSFAERLKSIIENNGIVNPRDVDRSGRNYEDIFDDTFGGYDEEDYSDIIEQLQSEANAHKQNAAAIKEEAAAQDELNHVQNPNIDLESVNKAYSTLESIDNIDYNQYDLDETQQALNKRKELLNSISNDVIDYDDDIAFGVEEIEQENAELEKRIELLQQVKRGLIDIYDVDDILKERGGLDDKLDRLQDVSSEWGSQIKDSEVDEDEDAIEALEQFEATYDRIVLKLANGRNIEILPNAKGLRALYKYYDGIDSSSYGETDIADVEFIRKEIPLAAQNAEHAVDGLNESLERTKQLTSESGDGTGDASAAELKAAKERSESLQNELISVRTQLEDERQMRVTTENALSDVISEKWDAEARAKESDKLRQENARLLESNEDLRNSLETNRRYYGEALLDAEHRANEAEAKVAQLEKGIVGSGGKQGAINSEELKNLLNAITYSVKIVYDDNDKQANKIALDDSTLESTLTKVFANILKPEMSQGIDGQNQGPWALESTLLAVNGVLDNVQTNTAKIGTVEFSNVDVITDTALDGKLSEIKSVLESIDNKIADGGTITKKDDGENKEGKKEDKKSTSSKRVSEIRALASAYANWGKLSAKAESDGNLETNAMIQNLEEEIKRKQQSLKLTKEEKSSLKEKYDIAFNAEKRLLDAAKAQEEIDKKNKQATQDEKAAWKKQVKDAQRETGINAADSTYRATNNTVIRAIGTEGISADIEAKAKELAEQNKVLNDLRNSINEKGTEASEKDRDSLSKQISKVKELKTEVDGYLKIHEKYSGEGATQFDVDTSNFGGVGTDQYWHNITAAIKNASSGRVTIKGMNTDTGELTGTTKIAANTFAEWSATVDPVTGKLSMLRTGIKKTETIIEQITRKTKEIFTYFSGSSIIFKAFNELKKGVQYVRDIDLAMTELKKVTDETEETYDKFLKTASKTAEKVGSTIKDVVSSTADWARLGYSMEQAAKFAETTQILMNVSEFTDVSQATDTLISAVQAFGYTAETSMDVVDLLNTIGNNYAISTADLAQSLTKSSASLVAAGGDLAEAAALTATANKIIQDADSVGTALKTTSLRLRGTDISVLEEEGLDSDGAVTSKSKLQSKVKALSGVDILTATGEYKSTYEILRDIADVWEDMNDMDQAALLELISGKRNSSVIAAILQNPEELKAAFEDANNASGSALKENEKYLDSIQGKIDQFNNATQAMWSNALDSDVVKGLVSLGTELVKIIDKLGVIPSLLITIATISMIKNKMGPIAFLTQMSNMLRSAPKQIGNFIARLTGMTTATSTYTAETLSASVANGALSASEAASMATKSGLTMATTSLTSAEAVEILTKNGMIEADALALVAKLGLIKETSVLTAEVVKSTMANAGYTPSQIAAAQASLFGAGANNTLAASFTTLWAAAWPVLAVMLAIAAVAGVFAIVAAGVDKAIVTVKELEEKMDGLRSEIDSLESDIDSLNSELETTQERMAELTAMPALSFTEEEELANLRAQNAELEYQLELKEKLKEDYETQLQDAATAWINKAFNDRLFSDKKYALDFDGSIVEDKWWRLGVSGKKALDKTFEKAAKKADRRDKTRGFYDDSKYGHVGWGSIGDAAASYGVGVGNTAIGMIVGGPAGALASISQIPDIISDTLATTSDTWAGVQGWIEGDGFAKSMADAVVQRREDEYNEIKNSLRVVLDDMSAQISENGLEYGINDDIDRFMDQYYAYESKYLEMQGISNKAQTISNIFADTRNEHMKALKEELQEIAKDDSLGDATDRQKAALSKINEALNDTSGNYSRLATSMEITGATAEEIARYFVNSSMMSDSSTVEGITAQYQLGIDAMQRFQEAGESANAVIAEYQDVVTGGIEQITWGSLFDDDGKVIDTQISKALQGADETARKEFARIAKTVNEGAMSVEDAITSFGMSGVQAGYKLLEGSIVEINSDIFKDLDDEISGLIDTFEEFGSALESVAKSIDLVTQAEAEMAYSGHLSVETALELINSTEDWNKVLKVENGNITLVDGAMDILAQSKLNQIKTNLQLALSEAQAGLEQARLAASSGEVAKTLEESTTESVRQLAANMEYLSTLIGEFLAGNFLGAGSAAAAAKQSSLDKTAYQTTSTTSSMSVADWEEKVNNIEAKLGILDGVDTPEEFNSNYSSDAVSGGNGTAEEVTDDRFQREMEYWENRISANQAKYEQLQNEIDLLESKGQKADASFYEEQIKLEGERKWLLEQQRAEAQKYLDTIIAAGNEGSEEYWDVATTLNDIEGELDDVTASIVDLQDAIGEIDTYKFEEFNTRLDNLTSKLETIRNLIAPDGEDDWFDNEGNWTEAGVAVLGSQLQQLEIYKQGYQDTVDELAKYESPYTGNESYYESLGIHSEQEYYDKTEELISQQYDYAESISDTEQSVVNMYESNIDAVEEYTETLISSYSDYIDSVKEALDAERDLYDFKRKIEDQSKSVAETERKIAALSGSDNAADVAERRRLEKTLYEQKRDLDDSYREHSLSSQQDALDKEAEAYETSMNNMIEGLRTSLEESTSNMDEFLMGVTSMVMYNADIVLAKYEETNLPLTTELTNPWEEAKNAVGDYAGDALDLMNQWTKDGGFFDQFNETGTTSLTSPWSSGANAVDTFKTSVSTAMANVVSIIETNVKKAKDSLSSLTSVITTTTVRADGSTGSNYSDNNGGYTTAPYTASMHANGKNTTKIAIGKQTDAKESNKKTVNGKQYYLWTDGYYYPMSAFKFLNFDYDERGKKTSVYGFPAGTQRYSYYAKGTTGTTRDQWAITDEPQFGDELVLVPGKDGTLSYMRKGTGIVPADLTANLMEWGKFAPESINMGGGVNVSMINNAVNKPEFNFAFDALVKAERIDENTLPEVKRFVQQEINSLVRQMNYAIKGKGGR